VRAWGQGEAGARGRARQQAARAHLHDVELGQQVAVGQGEPVAVEEAAAGGPELGVAGQLVRQRRAQVRVQLQQGPQQALPQRCGEGGSVRARGPCQPVPAPSLAPLPSPRALARLR